MLEKDQIILLRETNKEDSFVTCESKQEVGFPN